LVSKESGSNIHSHQSQPLDVHFEFIAQSLQPGVKDTSSYSTATRATVNRGKADRPSETIQTKYVCSEAVERTMPQTEQCNAVTNEPQITKIADKSNHTREPETGYSVSKKQCIKLDKFDGVSPPFATFMAKFRSASQYNQWDSADQLAHLRASLVGAAAQCMWDVTPGSADTLDDLIELLKSRFGCEGQAEKFRAELRTRKRKPGESLQSLYQDIRRLLSQAYPGPSNPTTEIVGRDSFLNALDDKNFALRVREREPPSLEQALKIALRFEAYGKADDYSVGNDDS